MIGACSFASYAVWRVSTPLAAGALAFATGIGAYGWVGFFFVISAELGGSRILLVRWDSYAAPWAAFAALSALAAAAT